MSNNKYCNLIGQNKFKDEYAKINDGFAFVENDVSSISSGGIIIISPHNATERSKKHADYVLDGENDQEIINNIISKNINPEAEWGKWQKPILQFTEGTIYLSRSIIISDSTVIRGLGRNTIFTLQDGRKSDLFTQANPGTILYHVELSNFWIDGNYQNNKGSVYFGIHLYPHECVLKNLFISNCYNGGRLYGDNIHSCLIYDCVIQNNFNYGFAVGGNTIIKGCEIIGNANTSAAEWNWGASGLFLVGWNIQIIGCHFADNLVDIFSNWTVYNQIQGCIFESGRKENIILEGRVWGFAITNNRFSGRRAYISNSINSIVFRAINPNEKAWGNIIANNSFSVYKSSDVGYNYCIAEDDNCDYNLIQGNIFKRGFVQTTPVLKTGNNTIIVNNID